MKFQNVKGTRDILPEDAVKWERLEKAVRKIMKKYNYREVRMPTFEETELFYKSTGEHTDIVQKEMFTFEDQGGRSLTLKPEGTPSVARMYMQHGMKNRGILQKFFYIERMFRQEKPQKGRYREFRQFGAEAIGSPSPETDAELVKSALDVFNELSIEGIKLNVNSIGCEQCRPDYVKKLKEYLRPFLDELCEDCNRRFDENPLRILDCKEDREKLEEVPVPVEHLCDDCSSHFEKFEKRLDKLGLDYNLDDTLVRGLDYYTRTVFEFIHEGLGAQDEVGGGGRYDKLLEFMGGEDVPASGYAVGMDRLLMLLEDSEKLKGINVYIITLDRKSDFLGWEIVDELRDRGFTVDKDPLERSIKAQFREADRQDAEWTIIIGEEERKREVIQIKNMVTGRQEEIPMDIKKIEEKLRC